MPKDLMRVKRESVKKNKKQKKILSKRSIFEILYD